MTPTREGCHKYKMTSPVKWTKKERNEIAGAITHAKLLGQGEASLSLNILVASAARAKVGAFVDAHKADAALYGLQIMVDNKAAYAARDRDHMAHINSETGARIYTGTHRDEMRARVAERLSKTEKAQRWYERLVAKIREHGLPTD